MKWIGIIWITWGCMAFIITIVNEIRIYLNNKAK